MIPTIVATMDDPPPPEAAPPPSPIHRTRRAAKGKARADPPADPPAAPSATPPATPAHPSAPSRGRSTISKSKRRRALSPESPPRNDDLFVADSEDEGALGDGETPRKPAGPQGLPRVEVELSSPPHKKTKVIHVATGDVRLNLHFVRPFHTHSIYRLAVALALTRRLMSAALSRRIVQRQHARAVRTRRGLVCPDPSGQRLIVSISWFQRFN